MDEPAAIPDQPGVAEIHLLLLLDGPGRQAVQLGRLGVVALSAGG
jgi:hypothetical protein